MLDKEFKLKVNYMPKELKEALTPFDPIPNLFSELSIRISYDDIDKLQKQWNLPDDALILKYLKEIESIKDNDDRYRQLFYLAIIGKNIYPIMKEIDTKVMRRNDSRKDNNI